MRRFRLASTHRKRRIRKKWRIGEFTEYGFEVWADAASGEAAEAAMDAMVALAESHGLCLGGGTSKLEELFVFVATPGRGTCTEDDRAAFQALIATLPGLSNSEVMPLEDAWA